MKRKALVYSETGPIHNSFVNFPIKKSNGGGKNLMGPTDGSLSPMLR